MRARTKPKTLRVGIAVACFIFIGTIAQASSPFVDLPDQDWMHERVQFWINIYTRYSTHEALIHDSDDVSRVYEIISIEGLDRTAAGKKLGEFRQKWQKTLKQIASAQSWSEEEQKIAKLFSFSPKLISQASNIKRIRVQVGQKDRFREGLVLSGKYLPYFEKVFSDAGIPVSLSRLPFVESGFKLDVRSKLGATGLWQFMGATGRSYLRIDPRVLDERNDPWRAALAAARLLKSNFETLGSWPLAVMAYNHGREGVARAVAHCGSIDLEKVLNCYRGPGFGFASRNFYFELLAAVEVERNAVQFFGELSRQRPLAFKEVGLADFISWTVLIKKMGWDEATLMELNPHFHASVYEGRRWIPRGYLLRIPDTWNKEEGGTEQAFLRKYLAIPEHLKHKKAF